MALWIASVETTFCYFHQKLLAFFWILKKPHQLATNIFYLRLKRADPLLRWLWSPEIPDTQKNSADLSFPKYKIEAFFVELMEQKQTKLWKQQPKALLLFNRTIKKEGQTLLSRQGRVPSYWGEILSESAFLGTLEFTCRNE